MQRVKQIIKAIVVLGTIAIALNLVFGNNTVQYIQKTNIGNTWLSWYRYDITGYIRNLETTLTDTTHLVLDLPTREWLNTDATMLEAEFWDVLGNNMALILDYIILAINVTLYPIKAGGYVLGIVLTLLGINLTNEASDIYWLCKVATTLRDIAIPYV